MSALGSLVVKLALEYAEYSRGLEKSSQEAMGFAQNVQRHMDTASTATKNFFGGIVAGAASAAAAYLSINAVIDRISTSIDTLASLDDLAQKTGSAVEVLSQMQQVASTFGHDFGQVDAAVSKLARGMNDLDEDGSKARRALDVLGVAAKDSAGKLRDPSQVLVDVAKNLQGYEDGASKAALVTDLLGKSGADLLPFLNDLAEKMDDFTGATTEAAREAAEFQDKLAVLRTTSDRLFQSVASDLVPSFNALLGALSDNIRAADDLNRSKGLKTWAEEAAEWTGIVIDKLLLVKRTISALRAEGWNWLENSGEFLKVALPGLTMNEDTSFTERFDRFMKNLRTSQTRKDADAAWAELGRSNAKAYQTQIAETLASAEEDNMFGAIFDAIGRPDKKTIKPSGGGDGASAVRAANKELEDQKKLIAEVNGLSGDFAEKWDRLNGIYRKGWINLDQLTEAQAKLLAQQPAIKKLLDLEAKAADAVAAEWEDAAKAKADYDKQYLDKQNAAIGGVNEYGRAIQQNNDLLEFEIGLLGQTETSRETSLAQYRIQLDLEKEILRIKALGLDYADQEQQIARARAFAAQASEGAAARVTLDYWKRINEDIGRSLTDALLDGGKNAGELLKNYFKTLVLRPIIEGFMAPISGAITMAMMPSTAQAAATTASTAGSAGNMLTAGKAIWDGFSSGFASNIGGLAQQLGVATNNAWLVNVGSGMKGAVGSAPGVGVGNMLGTAAGYAAGGIAGVYGGRAISNGFAISGSGNGLVNAGTIAGAFLGGPIGAAIGGLISGVANRAFGSKVVGSGVMGSISGGDFAGSAYQFKKGGFFKRDKTVTSALDSETNAAFSSAIEGMYANFSVLGDTIGVGGDLLKDFSYEFRLALADFDDAGKQKEIQRALSIMSDSMAQAFVDSFRTSIDTAQQAASRYFTNTIDGQRSFEGGVVEQTRIASPLAPYIDDMVRIFDTFRSSVAGVEGSEGKLSAFVTQLFGLGDALVENQGYAKLFGEALDFDKLEAVALKGESVVDTFARLTTVFESTNSVARALGKNVETAFGAIGVAGAEARQRLIDLAGGIDALASKTSFFYDNFVPEEKRMKTAEAQVRQRLNELGYWGVESIEKFAEEVMKLDLASEPGAKMYSALLDLAPAFLQVANYTKQATDAQNEANKAKLAAVAAERSAAIEYRRMAQEAAQSIVGDLAEGLKGIGAADVKKSLGNSLGLSEAEQGKYGQFVDHLQNATESFGKLADLGLDEELAGYTAQVKKLIDDSTRLMASGLAADRLRAGDGIGAMEARMMVDGPRGPWTTAGDFNRANALAMAKAGSQLAGQASADALNIPNVGAVIGQLMAPTFSDEFRNAIRSSLMNSVGLPVQGLITDQLSRVINAAVDKTVMQEYGIGGPGIGSVMDARAQLSYVSEMGTTASGKAIYGRDVIAYTQAVKSLDEILRSGRITTEEYATALNAANELTGNALALLNDEAAQQQRIIDAGRTLSSAGLSSIGYYFGEIANSVEALSKAASATAEPIAVASEAIGRLNSVSMVFGSSASAVLEGLAITGDVLSGTAATSVANAKLVAESAARAAAVITTQDAANAAKALRGKDGFENISASGMRDISLLLDGLKQFDAKSFEVSFMRINDALNKGSINETQYKSLVDQSLDLFTGVDQEADAFKNAMKSLADAMGSFADKLLIDQQRTTLTVGQTLDEMYRQYEVARSSAMTGDSAAVSNYQNLANALLDKGLYESQAAYNTVFGKVYGDARRLESVGVNTLAKANESGSIVAELKSLNTTLSKRVETLEKNLTSALAQIAKNTSKTEQGITQINTVGIPG